MADRSTTDPERMEKIVSLSKRKGFIFQSAELYGGLNGCWDYGPLGVELKNNLKQFWWRKNVTERDDIVGMDGSILNHQAVLTASGHVGGFSDPMCTCRHCKKHIRADKAQEMTAESAWANSLAATMETLEPSSSDATVVVDGASLMKWARKKGKQLAPNLALVRDSELTLSWISEKLEEGYKFTPWELFQYLATDQLNQKGLQSPCPHCGGELSEAKEFNLMFKTQMGATVTDDPNAVAYLRPETAQTIFTQYKNILDTSRLKLPFGIAQIGKAFRNEINPRNYTFRSREFEQMEIEFFCTPEQGLALTDEWLERRLSFYEEIGIPREKIHVLDVPDGERAHYSSKTYDLEYEFPFGIQELEGVAYRGDYDLSKHREHSGRPIEYFDEQTKEKFLPHVVEPSAGCDRTVLALLCEAYDEEELTDSKGKTDIRTVLHFDPKMAPIKAALFPLLKKSEAQVEIARKLQAQLQKHMNVFYDESGAVGRRYRRMDEVGTPFCITVDFETLGEEAPELKDTVTIRHRDSMEQERLPISEVLTYLLERIA